MNEPPLAPDLRAYALNFAARLAPMLRALALLAGYRFARNRILAPFLVPLQHHLHSAIRRMNALMAQLAAGQTMRQRRPSAARPPSAHPPSSYPPSSHPPLPRQRLPAGTGWLLRALPSEAILFTTQIAALLAEPEIAALLATCRRARRILAPIQRALSSTPRRRGARRSLIPAHPVPTTGLPPSAIPPFLLYPTPIPPPLSRKIPA